MAASRHVLLLGGNGKIARFLTPMLLSRSWTVTSVIRNPDQVEGLKKLGGGGQGSGGKLDVRVWSLDDVKSDEKAKSLIDEVKPDYVVWSAGAGGKGGAERTIAIDRDAASHFIRASVATPSVTRFLMVSHICSRRAGPPWWTSEQWEESIGRIKASLPVYYEAKIDADEVLYHESKKRRDDFSAICFRPGLLTDNPKGNVELGKLKTNSAGAGTSSREGCANVMALLLENPEIKSCWVDMLDGEEDPAAAVKRVVDEGIDCAEGEPYYQK